MSFRPSWSVGARALLVAGAFGVGLLSASCNDNSTSTGPSSTRTYDQVQRLGNPLVSEVLLTKRDHPYHGSIGPENDVADLGPKVMAFAAQFGRNAAVQNGLVGALLPDMLVVQTDKDPTTAGWLSWALTNGYGGRKLTDDVVTTALSAVFGKVFDSTTAVCDNGALPLCTDNVGPPAAFGTTFPYLNTPK